MQVFASQHDPDLEGLKHFHPDNRNQFRADLRSAHDHKFDNVKIQIKKQIPSAHDVEIVSIIDQTRKELEASLKKQIDRDRGSQGNLD